jgi:hypothetical protein
LLHDIHAPRPHPAIESDAAIVSSFLSDAAHVPGGFAAGVVFPRDEPRSRHWSQAPIACCLSAHSRH